MVQGLLILYKMTRETADVMSHCAMRRAQSMLTSPVALNALTASSYLHKKQNRNSVTTRIIQLQLCALSKRNGWEDSKRTLWQIACFSSDINEGAGGGYEKGIVHDVVIMKRRGFSVQCNKQQYDGTMDSTMLLTLRTLLNLKKKWGLPVKKRGFTRQGFNFACQNKKKQMMT